MFAATELSNRMQRFVCLMLSAVAVATTLSLSVYGALPHNTHAEYSVTVHY